MKSHRATSVGIRALKANLSAYLRRAQAGEHIQVTDRGRPVADLTPPQLSDEEVERRLKELEKQGRLLPATSNDTTWLRNWKGIKLTRKQREQFWRDFEWSREDKF